MKAFLGALPLLIKATLSPGGDQTVGSLAGFFCSSEPTSFQPPLCSPPKKAFFVSAVLSGRGR